MNSTRTSLLALLLTLLTLVACGAPPDGRTFEPGGEEPASFDDSTEEPDEDAIETAPTLAVDDSADAADAPSAPPALRHGTTTPEDVEEPEESPDNPIVEPVPVPNPSPIDAPVCDARLSDVLFPPLPALVHPELAEQIQTRNIVGVLETALNSADDEIAFEFGGSVDVPLLGTLGLGGDGSMALGVSVDEDGYLVLEGGKDAALAANLSAGIASASVGSSRSVSVKWRFGTADDVATAMRNLVILRAIGPRLGERITVLNTRIAQLDGVINDLKAKRRAVIDQLFVWADWDGELLDDIRKRMDERNRVQSELARLNELIAWVAETRTSLDSGFAGVTLELGSEAKVSAGVTPIDNGGDAGNVFGWEVSAGVERVVIVEIEGAEVASGVSADVTVSFRTKASGEAGAKLGISTKVARRLEITGRGTLTADGVSIDVPPTGTLVLAREFRGAVGVFLSAGYGVGRESQVSVELRALAEQGPSVLVALITGSPDELAEALSKLPLEFGGQGRIERGITLGIGGELGKDLIGGGLYAEALWTDKGNKVSMNQTPCVESLAGFVTDALDNTISDETYEILDVLGAQNLELRGE